MEKGNLDLCPICQHKLGKDTTWMEDHGRIYHINCAYCGEYQLSGFQMKLDLGFDVTGQAKLPKADPKLSVAIRQKYIETGKEVIITHENRNEIKNSIYIPEFPLERVDVLLKYLYQRSKSFAENVLIPITDYPLLYALNEQELHITLEFANEMEYLRYQISNTDNANIICIISLKGWDRIQELTSGKVQTKQAFIAMKFRDEELNQVYLDAIVPAVIEAGFAPYRIDKQEFNEKICDKIIADIKKSGFLIADFTGHRGGVYFEAGYALGLGKPVIWCSREDDLENLHFDTRQYNHIVWKNAEDLREQLFNRIKATIEPA